MAEKSITHYIVRMEKEKIHYDLKDLEVDRITIFDLDEDTKRPLLYQAYNGGREVVEEKSYFLYQTKKRTHVFRQVL